jgi:hypothetical protein
MNKKVNHFDRGKIFYPYVINYIVTIHGLIDLFSRAITLQLKKIPNNEDRKKVLQLLKKDMQTNFLKHDGERPLVGNLSLKSAFQGNSIDIDIDEIAEELINNYQYLLPFQMKAAGNLFIMCYAISEDTYDDKSEIWNFFYHCRNAAAHGGLFNITNVKRFPAKWGSLEITTGLNKTNLFHVPGEGGLIGLGDPIRLLWDIEQTYIK